MTERATMADESAVAVLVRGFRKVSDPGDGIRAYCECGDRIAVTLECFDAAFEAVEFWRAAHDALGHKPCNIETANRVRTRKREKAREAERTARREQRQRRQDALDLAHSIGAGPFRLYVRLGGDGYPLEWHETVKHLVREQAGHRCIRCGHPYVVGENGLGEWSRCDAGCTHDGPVRYFNGAWHEVEPGSVGQVPFGSYVEARWRILTVHHLNSVKADCRWWNLAALCQRCHLKIQAKVDLHRVWPWEHSDWFKPYAAGWYASAYLGEELTREETMARLDELLALERSA